MRIVFASDIHGNESALSKVVEICKRIKADRFVLTGDITGFFGTGNIAEILSPVSEITSAVLGNCDNEYFISKLNILFDKDYGIIRDAGRNIFYTHGHIFSKWKLPPVMEEGDLLVSGHSHIPGIDINGRYVFANPGSLGNPRGGFPASYMVYDNGKLSIFDLEGSIMFSEQINAEGL